MNKKVYLDTAATTYVSNEVLNEMIPCFNIIYGNSSSLHSFGRDAVSLVDRARDRISKAINAQANEIYFTSGGTEANNWALKGIAHANCHKGKHIITTQIEHHSVLDVCKSLENEGFEVTYLPVDENGLVSIAELLHYIRRDTILVSVMSVNNEVGTIQNIKTISKIAHENGAFFHTDAVQAIDAIKLDVVDMEIDIMSISSHKVYGPKGVGALFIKNGTKIANLIEGGNQERGRRGGTVNVPAVVGFGKAVEIAVRDLSVNQHKLKSVRDYFLRELTNKIPYIKVNGHTHQKSNSIINISFEMIEGESILLLLDMAGIAVSTGSACTTGAVSTSHVLKAMCVPDEFARGSVRFSFSKSILKEEIDYVIENLISVVSKLRAISPITKTGRAK